MIKAPTISLSLLSLHTGRTPELLCSDRDVQYAAVDDRNVQIECDVYSNPPAHYVDVYWMVDGMGVDEDTYRRAEIIEVKKYLWGWQKL